MERLTMYEVIEHCKRKVQKVETMFRKEHLESDNCGVADLIQKEYWEHRQVAEWLEQLKAYKDAEEQGLLLRLPCKVGSTVYYIDDYEIYSDKVDSINIRKENEEYIFCIAFMDYRADDFGKTVFLTREEAEQALAEMQKG